MQGLLQDYQRHSGHQQHSPGQELNRSLDLEWGHESYLALLLTDTAALEARWLQVGSKFLEELQNYPLYLASGWTHCSRPEGCPWWLGVCWLFGNLLTTCSLSPPVQELPMISFNRVSESWVSNCCVDWMLERSWISLSTVLMRFSNKSCSEMSLPRSWSGRPLAMTCCKSGM